MFKENFITMILAAGGIGSRMGSPVPKQYIPLSGKPIALHSFELFCQMDEIDEIVVVCEPEFRHLFLPINKPILFADPGQRRQDSILNGFNVASKKATIICTHDAARPFIERNDTLSLLEKVVEIGAATLASPVIYTIKECDVDRLVKKTLDRSQLWDIQTPQALRRSLFEQGFDFVKTHNISITDDTILAELLDHPVVVVPSSSRNFKITTPLDLSVAETLCNSSCATN